MSDGGYIYEPPVSYWWLRTIGQDDSTSSLIMKPMCPWCCEDLDDCKPCEGRNLWWMSQYGVPPE